MNKAEYYDLITKELFDKHSLAAIVILISSGRELDFRYNNMPCSITWINNKLKLENQSSHEINMFIDIEDLIMNGKINSHEFIKIWNEFYLDFLY